MVRKRQIWVISAIFVPCDLEIWRITLKNNRAHLLCYFKLCASFPNHWWIQPRLQSGNAQIGSKWVPCDLEIWLMNVKNNRAPPLCYFKRCASFHSHLWIQNGVTVRKRQIWVKIVPCDLEIWLMNVKNNRAHLLCYFKLFASFHSHLWFINGVTDPETPKLSQNRRFFVPCDLEIWQITLKKIWFLFYDTSSFKHHFITIGEFELKLQAGNAQFGSKSTIF